ncbi:hypothetical protein ABVK25_012407 [Lepraria finkii]|uniref:Uncharacterized protein n=1 Tax=Lepraria finkii TaxID=1340010 RepID=A0ABR4AFC5_9LECA
MASLFSSRRKPKRIAREDPEAEQDDDDSGPVVRRPGAVKAKSKTTGIIQSRRRC